MTRLPLMVCPACAAEMTLDVVFGHTGAREAVQSLAALDPAAKLLPASLRYVTLFAPSRQRLRFDRLATVLRELEALIAPAKLEHRGRLLPAPRDYWVAAMDEMTGPRRDSLSLPMKSHGYLKSIVAGYADKAAAASEAARENRRGGRSPVGGLPPPPPPEKTQPTPKAPRKRLTEADKNALQAALSGEQPKQETEQ